MIRIVFVIRIRMQRLLHLWANLLACGACYFRKTPLQISIYCGNAATWTSPWSCYCLRYVGYWMCHRSDNTSQIRCWWRFTCTSVFNNEFLSTGALWFFFRRPRVWWWSRYKISLRTSKDGYDVSRLAQLLGGGGHVKAAGAITTRSSTEILKILLRVTITQEKPNITTDITTTM